MHTFSYQQEPILFPKEPYLFFRHRNHVDGIEKTIEWYLRNRKWWGDIASGEYMKYYEKMYGERLKLGTREILKGSHE
jgi:hypothetical protein